MSTNSLPNHSIPKSWKIFKRLYQQRIFPGVTIHTVLLTIFLITKIQLILIITKGEEQEKRMKKKTQRKNTKKSTQRNMRKKMKKKGEELK